MKNIWTRSKNNFALDGGKLLVTKLSREARLEHNRTRGKHHLGVIVESR
jgi:hypothetical protein